MLSRLLAQTESLLERRSHPRTSCGIPITLTCRCGELSGVTVDESYTGVLVQLMDDRSPEPGEECQVRLQVMGESVEARGEVVRLASDERQCAIELKQLGGNGYLLLALMASDE